MARRRAAANKSNPADELLVISGESFVGEVWLSVPLHGRMGERHPIKAPEQFGLLRGYWHLRADPDGLPDGVTATVEFRAETLEEAEDRVLSAGRLLTLMLGLYAGGPPSEPQIVRLARCQDEQLCEQWDYSYEPQGASSVPVDRLQIERIQERLGAISPELRRRVLFAMRWYAHACESTDPTDTYLSLWVGLEAVSPPLHALWHAPGTVCSVCPLRKNRDEKLAGAEHLILVTAPELLDEVTFNQIRQLRANITHALLELSEGSLDKVKRALPDLQLSLGRGILTALAMPATGDSWEARLPRDTSPQPSSRANVASKEPLRNHQPYFGTWAAFERSAWHRATWIGDDGTPFRGEAPSLAYEIRLSTEADTDNVTRGFVRFVPDGIAWTSDPSLGGEEVPNVEWRARTRTPAWERASQSPSAKGSGTLDRGPIKPGRPSLPNA